jgi:hypothetical protein
LLVFFPHLARMLLSLVGYVRLSTRPPHSFAFPQPAQKILRKLLLLILNLGYTLVYHNALSFKNTQQPWAIAYRKHA